MAKYSKITEESTPEVTSRSINIFLVILKLSIVSKVLERHNVSGFEKRGHFAHVIFERMPVFKWLLVCQILLKVNEIFCI